MAVDWPIRKLADLCDSIDYGYTASAKDRSCGPKFLRITDIVSGCIDWNAVPYCEIDESVVNKFRLYNGDVVIARTGATTGYSAHIAHPPDAVFASYLVRLRLGRDADSRFISYFLKSPWFWGYIRGVLGDKSAQPNASAKTLTQVTLRLPPLKEQKAIAHILATLDDKIELNRRMNETLEAMARALFKSWFVDFDPVRAKAEGRQPEGLDTDTAALFPDSFEDSKLGKIPKGWRVKSLADISEIVMGQSPPGETYNETGEGLPFYQGIRDFGWRFPSRRVYCIQPTRFAKRGDVLLSVRAPVGSLNLATEACAIGRGLAALRQKPTPGSFLYYLLKSDYGIWEKFEAKGTVFGAATKDDIHNIEAIQPSNHQVTEVFNKIAGMIDAKIESNEDQSRTLAALRDAMLPKLLSGEVRVKDAERILEKHA